MSKLPAITIPEIGFPDRFTLPTTENKNAWVAAGAAATAATIALWVKRRNRLKRLERQEGCEIVQLMPNENSFIVTTSPPMNTVTFFEAVTAEDVEAARTYFEARTEAIVEANPWLAGFLDVDPTDKSGYLSLFVPPEGEGNSRPSFEVLDTLGPLSEDYHTMVKTLEKAMIGNTVGHVASVETTKEDGWEPLWKVAFIPDTSGEKDNDEGGNLKFGLVVSGNHSLIDGHGYYRLFNMLSSQEPIQSLSPIRKHNLGDRIKAATGTETNFLESPPLAFVLGFVSSVIRNAIFPQTKSIGFEVSQDWIDQQKKDYRSSILEGTATDGPAMDNVEDPSPPAFLSTNDLVVSSFCQETECDLALMATNLRGRAKGCTDDLVGNYEHLLAYTKDDYSSPQDIRRSISGPPYQRVGAGTTSLPSSFQYLFGGLTYAAITNWATFATAEIAVGDNPMSSTYAKQTLHLPLFDFPESTPACTYSSMVIFRPRAGAVAILAGGKERLMNKLKIGGIVGSMLYEPS
jgi:hypothetical protein